MAAALDFGRRSVLSQHLGGLGIEHDAPLLVGLGVLLLQLSLVVQVDSSADEIMSRSRSRWDQRRPQISPRRAPVVMWVQTSVPQSGSEDQARSTSRAASCAVGGVGSGWGSGGLLACCGRVDGDPLPDDSAVEGAADDPVDLADRRVRQSAADVRLAGAAAGVAVGRVGRRAGLCVVLVAAVLLARAVLKSWPAVAVLAAAAQLGVEGVQGLDVEPGQGQRPEQRPDVLADVVRRSPVWSTDRRRAPRATCRAAGRGWPGSADCAARRPDSACACGPARPLGRPSARPARPR